MVTKAEKVLEESLDPSNGRTGVAKIKQDTAKFVTERLKTQKTQPPLSNQLVKRLTDLAISGS